MKKIPFLLVLVVMISGCASIYKPIRPETVEYSAHSPSENIDFWYRYDVLAYRGNNRYSKKERKNGVSIVAVKITNQTSQPINLARNLELGITRGPVYPMDSETAAEAIRQKVWLHLLWGLLWYTESECVGNECEYTTVVPFGLFIAALNIGVAANSNTKLKQELTLYSLYNRDIAPGETVHGLVPLRDIGFQPLSIKLKPEKTGND